MIVFLGGLYAFHDLPIGKKLLLFPLRCKNCRGVVKCGDMFYVMVPWSGIVSVCSKSLHCGSIVGQLSTGIIWSWFCGLGFLVEPVFIFMVFISNGCTCWNFSGYGLPTSCTCWDSCGYASTIVTLGGFSWSVIRVVFGLFYVIGWWFRYISCSTTLRGMPWGVELSNILSRSIIDSLWEFPIVNSRIYGAGLCRAWINSCVEWIAASVDDIFGIMYFGVKSSTVSEILFDICLGI